MCLERSLPGLATRLLASPSSRFVTLPTKSCAVCFEFFAGLMMAELNQPNLNSFLSVLKNLSSCRVVHAHELFGRVRLWNNLDPSRVPVMARLIVRKCYGGMRPCMITCGGEFSELLSVKRGLCQGSVATPLLFKMLFMVVLRLLLFKLN